MQNSLLQADLDRIIYPDDTKHYVDHELVAGHIDDRQRNIGEMISTIDLAELLGKVAFCPWVISVQGDPACGKHTLVEALIGAGFNPSLCDTPHQFGLGESGNSGRFSQLKRMLDGLHFMDIDYLWLGAFSADHFIHSMSSLNKPHVSYRGPYNKLCSISIALFYRELLEYSQTYKLLDIALSCNTLAEMYTLRAQELTEFMRFLNHCIRSSIFRPGTTESLLFDMYGLIDISCG